jgi:hypothetical protein
MAEKTNIHKQTVISKWLYRHSKIEITGKYTRNLATDVKFQACLQGARALANDFFHYKGNGNLNIC